MASIGIHPSGKLCFPSFVSGHRSNSMFSSNPSLAVSKKLANQGLWCCAAITPSNPAVVSPPGEFGKGDSRGNNGVFPEVIDSWMRDSVEDIVKNLKQAPLMVRIYSVTDVSGENNGRVRIQTEKAIMDKWPEVKNQWETGESKTPDGLIFVDELEESPDQVNEDDLEDGVTRAWGLVVQGKGAECGPTCYLLKTNRVCGGMGSGCCTHFCLMRVKNFRDSALEQFRDSWLLQ